MSIKSAEELRGMRAAGGIVRAMLATMRDAVRPGVTTRELDEVGAEVMRRNGGRSAPAMVYKFPGVSCISINDEAVHGIPGGRKVREGDLVKLDVTVEKNGFMADAAVTVAVGAVSNERQQLARCVERAFAAAMPVARAGKPICEIGRAIEREVRQSNFFVIRALGGHGIGRTIHEEPTVPNYFEPAATQVLTVGLVITIEPIIGATSESAVLARDGWTIRTADGGSSAHYEHTLVITTSDPILLTAA